MLASFIFATLPKCLGRASRRRWPMPATSSNAERVCRFPRASGDRQGRTGGPHLEFAGVGTARASAAQRHRERAAPGGKISSNCFAKPIVGISTASSMFTSTAALNCPLPPSMTIRSGSSPNFSSQAIARSSRRRDRLPHRGEIVRPFHGPDLELAVVGLLRLPGLEHDHSGHRFRALGVADVEGFDAIRQVGQRQLLRTSMIASSASSLVAPQSGHCAPPGAARRSARRVSTRRRFSPRCGVRRWTGRLVPGATPPATRSRTAGWLSSTSRALTTRLVVLLQELCARPPPGPPDSRRQTGTAPGPTIRPSRTNNTAALVWISSVTRAITS